MADSLVIAVGIGLAVGVAFIAVFGVMFTEATLIDNIHQVPLDRGKNQQIIDVILQDQKIVDLLKDRYIILIAIRHTSWYDQCTFGPPATVIMQTGRGYLFVWVDYHNSKVVSAGMQVFGKMTPIYSQTFGGTVWKPNEQTEQIVSGMITVKPHESHFVRFTVPDCAIDVRVGGSFAATGSEDNDIIVLVMPENEYDNWRKGSNFGAYGGSGKVTTEIVEAWLPRGEKSVYLVFDNTVSNSTKTINADIELSYK